MEYIIIIFFIIIILYNYLYEYYDECKIKNCNSNYYLNNNTCTKCEGIVSPDGKKCCNNMSSQGYSSYNNDCSAASCSNGQQSSNNCVCSYPKDENIIKNAAVDYYNNYGVFKGEYTMEAYDINKVNDNTVDISYVAKNIINKNYFTTDKRRFTFNINNSNCSINITSMGEYNSGITVKDAQIKCTFPNDELVKNAAVDYYNSIYLRSYTIKPYYINIVNETTFDMSYIYISADGTDIGPDKRRFTFNYNLSNCNINITNMGNYLSGITAKDAEFVKFNLLIHKQSGKCLDGDGNNVYINNCNNNNIYQQWSNQDNLLIHKKSGKCLEGDGTKLYFNTCGTYNTYQQQFPSEPGLFNSLYRLKGSNKCLDSNGSNVYFGNCDMNNIYQNWYWY